MSNRIELGGKKFGAWTVLDFAGINSYKQSCWNCVCDCGTRRAVVARTLRDGSSVGCGCTKLTILRKLRTTHGFSKSVTYDIWIGMLKRCHGKTKKGYKYYFSQGVTVCERWHKFENFLADMGERPPGLSIDRYPDPFGNYEPGNCRWASASEQAFNRRPRSIPVSRDERTGRYLKSCR